MAMIAPHRKTFAGGDYLQRLFAGGVALPTT
jgi:hypothetical protein